MFSNTTIYDTLEPTRNDNTEGFKILRVLSIHREKLDDYVAPVFHLNKETGRYTSKQILGIELELKISTFKTYKGVKLLIYDMLAGELFVSEFMKRKEKRGIYINENRIGTLTHFMRSRANVTYTHPFAPFATNRWKSKNLIYIHSASEENLDTLVLGIKGYKTYENCTALEKVKSTLAYRSRYRSNFFKKIDNASHPYLNLLGTKH